MTDQHVWSGEHQTEPTGAPIMGSSGLPDGLIGGPALARHVGATYRQVNRWRALGVLHPHHQALGSGSRVAYTDEECRVAEVVVRLVRLTAGLAGPQHGLPVLILTAAATAVRADPRAPWLRLASTDDVSTVTSPRADGALYLSLTP